MLLILSQRRLKFENLKLDLLDFLESGDLAVVDLVVHARYSCHRNITALMS